jgi:hypothetical protein
MIVLDDVQLQLCIALLSSATRPKLFISEETMGVLAEDVKALLLPCISARSVA